MIGEVDWFLRITGTLGFLLWLPSICRFVASYWRLKNKSGIIVFWARWGLSKIECETINWILVQEEHITTLGSGDNKQIYNYILVRPNELHSKLEPGLSILLSKGFIADYSDGWPKGPPFSSIFKTGKFSTTFEF